MGNERSWLLLAVAGLFAMLAGLALSAGGSFLHGVSDVAAALAVIGLLGAAAEFVRTRRVGATHASASSSSSRPHLGQGPMISVQVPIAIHSAVELYPPQAVADQAPDEVAEALSVSHLYEHLLRHVRAEDRYGEANVYNLLGFLNERRDELASALIAHNRALRLFTDLGDRVGRGDSLNNVGVVLARNGDPGGAMERHREALTLRTGDRLREANSYNNMGVAVITTDVGEARRMFEPALELARSVEDRRGEGKVLNNLAVCSILDRDIATASEYFGDALMLRERGGDARGHAKTLNNLGLTQLVEGHATAAQRSFDESSRVSRDVEDRRSRINAERNLYLAIEAETGRAADEPYERRVSDGESVEMPIEISGGRPVAILSSGSMSPQVSLRELADTDRRGQRSGTRGDRTP